MINYVPSASMADLGKTAGILLILTQANVPLVSAMLNGDQARP